MSLVLYEPIRNLMVSEAEVESGDIPFMKRLMAAGISGGLSIAVMNPTEVLKTQMMTSQKETKSMLQISRNIMASEGILGFWAGVKPNIVRTFLVQAAEIGVYDQAKFEIAQYVGGNNFWAHLGASGTAGLASALTSTPADVIKTRYMNNAGTAQQYNSMFDAGKSIVKEGGAKALYKGFIPILVRKLAWVSSFFVVFEQVRPLTRDYMS
jgi:hypothetical protein